MTLIDRLTRIAEQEGIPTHDLLLDEASFFIEQHHRHGGYEIRAGYDEGGKLRWIHVQCLGDALVDTSQCIHQDPTALGPLRYSIVHDPFAQDEIEVQRKYRAGEPLDEYFA